MTVPLSATPPEPEDLSRMQALLEADRDPAFRARTGVEVFRRASARLAAARDEPGSPVDLSVVPAFVQRVRWTDFPPPMEPAAGVWICLGLSLYLGHAPTAEELRAALRAWRRTLPWDGSVLAGPCDGSVPRPLAAPAEEDHWRTLIDTRPDQGSYGLVWIESRGAPAEADPTRRTFSVQVPAEVDGEQAAALCQVTLPLELDPAPLPGLALALLEALPVLSGIGGLQARFSSPAGLSICYGWCRQWFGLDLQDPDMVYPPLRTGLRGAGWLTVLGSSLAEALERSGRLTLPEGVESTRATDGGLVLQASPAPDPGPIRAGVPPALAQLDRILAPLKIGSPEDAQGRQLLQIFEISDDRYGPWLYRFQDPTRFLSHTTRELAELAQPIAEQGTELEILELAHLVSRAQAGENDRLGSDLYNAGCEASRRGLPNAARRLYELCLEQPDVPVQAIGNLIVTYLQLGDVDLACELTEQHLDLGDPYVLVNGACAFGERGDAERALELLKSGLAAGFAQPELIREDESLALLRDDPRFWALFETDPD